MVYRGHFPASKTKKDTRSPARKPLRNTIYILRQKHIGSCKKKQQGRSWKLVGEIPGFSGGNCVNSIAQCQIQHRLLDILAQPQKPMEKFFLDAWCRPIAPCKSEITTGDPDFLTTPEVDLSFSRKPAGYRITKLGGKPPVSPV